ncbi:MAG: DUF1272 domain-containing protein [Marinibacterium sp.]|nr:DUF1272 domain-containing protein [Marinibacterium sp.]
MLDIRPNCEWCDRDLPADSTDARICSYECTYCSACAEEVLQNVCPTCGGNLCPRPIRPKAAHRHGLQLGLGHHPASTTRRHTRWSAEEAAALTKRLRDVPPQAR